MDGSQFYRCTVFPDDEDNRSVNEMASNLSDGVASPQQQAFMYGLLKRYESLYTSNSVTALPNRIVLRQRLEQAVAASQRKAYRGDTFYISLDVGGFKRTNDTYGHHVGDRMLRATGRYLRESIHQSDLVTHPSGDEFTLLCFRVNDAGGFVDHMDGICKAYATGVRVVDPDVPKDHRNTISMGVVRIDPRTTVEDVVHKGEQALYHAKTIAPAAHLWSAAFVERYEQNMRGNAQKDREKTADPSYALR